MSFYPSLQAYVGPNTGTANSIATPDWINGKVYVGGGATNLTRLNMSSGAEEQYAALSSYTGPPAPDFFNVPAIDPKSNLYYQYGGYYGGGGIVQIAGLSLAYVMSSSETQYDGSGDGNLSANTDKHGNAYVLACGEGDLGFTSRDAIFLPVTYAGFFYQWPASSGGNSVAICCSGMPKQANGYVMVGPGGVAGSNPQIWIYAVTLTSPSQTLIANLFPIDFDATWTGMSISGMCIDQTDGNLLVSVYGNTGGIGGYLAKIDLSTGDIAWKLPNGGTGGFAMQYSLIKNGRFGWWQSGSVYVANTITGDVTSYSAGLAGISYAFGGYASTTDQAYNDTLGGIFLPVAFSQTSGSPTLLNSTPTSYFGWSLLYVATPITPSAKQTSYAQIM